MGRGKKKRKAKLADKRKLKRKKGLNTPLNLFNNILKPLRSNFYYDGTIHNKSASKSSFYNIRFKKVNITYCSFKQVKFNGIDFIFSNLKHSKFTNCSFEDTVFFATNIKYVKFKNCSFKNVYFFNTDTSKISCIDFLNSEISVINKYPNLTLSKQLNNALEKLALNERILKNRVIHVTKNKPNYWIVSILLKDFSEGELVKGFNKLSYNSNSNSNRNFFTYKSFKDYLNKYLKKC